MLKTLRKHRNMFWDHLTLQNIGNSMIHSQISIRSTIIGAQNLPFRPGFPQQTLGYRLLIIDYSSIIIYGQLGSPNALGEYFGNVSVNFRFVSRICLIRQNYVCDTSKPKMKRSPEGTLDEKTGFEDQFWSQSWNLVDLLSTGHLSRLFDPATGVHKDAQSLSGHFGLVFFDLILMICSVITRILRRLR